MKKIFKVMGVIVIIIAIFVGIVFGYIVIKNNILNNERRNAKTLMDYVKTHDWEHLHCQSSKDCFDMRIAYENFKCDVLDNKEVVNLSNLDNTLFITQDNAIYRYSFASLFSNDQNCKKVDIKSDAKIKVRKGLFILGNDDQVYTLSYYLNEGTNEYIELQKDNSRSEAALKEALNNDDVKDIFNIVFNYDKYETYILVLKKDNNLYTQTYKMNNSKDSSLIKEDLYMSLEKYGNIKYLRVKYTNDFMENEPVEDTILEVLSDKGYFFLGEVKTDECLKYEDIKCKLELKESEIYKKFNKDIKYIGQNYTVLNDNSVIENEYLTYPLDSDLRN